MDVILYNQMDAPRLYNGCEVTSLAMLLHYSGYEQVTKTHWQMKSNAFRSIMKMA